MYVTRSTTLLLLNAIGLLIVLSGCLQSGKSQGHAEIQGKTTDSSVQGNIAKKFGSPIKAALAVYNGDEYDSFEIRNVENVVQIWHLLAASPNWHETAQPDDYIQGMPPVANPYPPWIFNFTLSSVSGKTNVRFEILPHDKTASCYVDENIYSFLNISENQEAIRSFVEREKNKNNGSGALNVFRQ